MLSTEMIWRRRHRLVAAGAALVTLCAPLAPAAARAQTQGPEQGLEQGPAATLAAATDTTPAGTQADVRFMQGMIAHHAQALVMCALIPTHAQREDMRLLGQRITVSQRDEIGLMRRWLLDRHFPAPDPLHADSASMHGMQDMQGMHGMAGHDGTAGAMHTDMHMSGAMQMPGMLTEEQMATLAAATGPAFDRLFLQDMIQHHQGALHMVSQLFATPGAAQDPSVFSFASDVVADQTAEIQRMQALLGQLAAPAATPSRTP